MEWNESTEQPEPHEDFKDDYRDAATDFPPDRAFPSGPGFFRLWAGNPYLWMGIVLLVIMIVTLVFFVSGARNASNTARIDELELRIQNIEKRVSSVLEADEKVNKIWEQAKTFEKFKERFNRSEASILLRMDHLATSLDINRKMFEKTKNPAKNKIVPKKQKQAVSKPPLKKLAQKIKKRPIHGTSKTIFHKIIKGETLYSISQRYNVSIADLRRINNLKKEAVIRPGQKLKIR